MDDTILDKSNTDCLYYLASPLLCKKGDKCEYRHSEIARLNPQECYFWMQGKCLKPNCPFRHPPIQGKPKAEEVSTPVCWFFQNGICTKGEACTFLHSNPSQEGKMKDELANLTQENKSVGNPNSALVTPLSLSSKIALEKLGSTISSPHAVSKSPVTLGSNKWVLNSQGDNANKAHAGIHQNKVQPFHSLSTGNPLAEAHVHAKNSKQGGPETGNHVSHVQPRSYSWQASSEHEKKQASTSNPSVQHQTISAKWAAAAVTAPVSPLTLQSKSWSAKNGGPISKPQAGAHHLDGNNDDECSHVFATTDNLSSPGFDVIVDSNQKFKRRSIQNQILNRGSENDTEDIQTITPFSKRLLFDKATDGVQKAKENEANRLKRPRVQNSVVDDQRRENLNKMKNDQAKSANSVTLSNIVAGNKMLRSVIETISQNNTSSVLKSTQEDFDNSLKVKNKFSNRLSFPKENDQATGVEKKGKLNESSKKSDDLNVIQAKGVFTDAPAGFSAPKSLAEIRAEKAKQKLTPSESQNAQKRQEKGPTKDSKRNPDNVEPARINTNDAESKILHTTSKGNNSVPSSRVVKEQSGKKLNSTLDNDHSELGFQAPKPLSAILKRKKRMESENEARNLDHPNENEGAASVSAAGSTLLEKNEKVVWKRAKQNRSDSQVVHPAASVENANVPLPTVIAYSSQLPSEAMQANVEEDAKEKAQLKRVTKTENDADYIGLLDGNEDGGDGGDIMEDFSFDMEDEEDLEKKLTGFFE